MDHLQTDDIGRLLVQLDLDQTQYRVFRSASSSPFQGSSREDFEETAISLQGYSSGQFREAAENGAYPKTSFPKRIEAPAERAVDRPAPVQGEEWSVLDSLFKLSTTISAGKSSAERSDPSPLQGTTLFGACGGVGTTSILAALGRIGAKAAQRILLVDSTSPSFLPFYFGGQSPRTFISTFISSDQSREQPIHIACGKTEEPLRALASELDRFYVDGGLFRANEATSADGFSGISLLVVVPDARCLAELKRLERQEVKVPFLLLNQYDSRQPLHREVQYLLGQRFRDRLLPITVSYDPDVSAAMAQGKTIVDYSPHSAATEDLYKLNEWLALNANSRNSPKLELAAAGKRL